MNNTEKYLTLLLCISLVISYNIIDIPCIINVIILEGNKLKGRLRIFILSNIDETVNNISLLFNSLYCYSLFIVCIVTH